jgi:hypothetical protein
MKLREYGTYVISHELSYASASDYQTRNSVPVRNTDTFKSRVLDSSAAEERPAAGVKTAITVHANSRKRLFSERPLTAKITRASYQDSNIFGYKDAEDITVQVTAKVASKH